MKRLWILLTALLLLTACTPAPVTREPLSLDYGGVSVTVGASVDELLTLWGEDYTRQESASCAGVGVDYLYTFPSMRLYSFAPEGGEETVTAITYTDDSTDGADTRGARIGATAETVIAAFGKPDEQSETRLIFLDEVTALTVTLRDGRVTGMTLTEK
ncbi:MAG: hypothetical protein J6R04_01870 [Clostridia bacterium]|nr:hypothetical protein [Clostridia bacterium]